MKISLEKKKKLQKLLGGVSTDLEKQELQKLDALKVKEIAKFFEDVETENNDKIDKLQITIEKLYTENVEKNKKINEYLDILRGQNPQMKGCKEG